MGKYGAKICGWEGIWGCEGRGTTPGMDILTIGEECVQYVGCGQGEDGGGTLSEILYTTKLACLCPFCNEGVSGTGWVFGMTGVMGDYCKWRASMSCSI